MEKREMVARLVEEFGYPEDGAHLVADRLNAMQPAVKRAFEKWWAGDTVQFEVEGFTVERLAGTVGLKPIAAFLTLDWLVREPQKAKIAIRRGYDYVALPNK